MGFYGIIVDVDDSVRQTLTIKERGSERLRKISLTDTHWMNEYNNNTIIIASGNILTDNSPEIVEQLVILEIKLPVIRNIKTIVLNRDCLDAEVFVHSRHL